MKIEKVETGYLEENCYVLSIEDKCLLIDPGDEFDKIKNLIGNKKVLACLITHYHFDHVGALEEVKEFYRCPVIDYNSNKIQEVGPFKFEIIYTPGHKEDAVTYYFKDDKVMFVGDFIFEGTIGRCDLEGGDFNKLLESLKLIKKYDSNITLYPGHGNHTTLKNELENNPYLRGEIHE